MTKQRTRPPNAHRLVGTTEAAEYANCSPRTIMRRIADGTLKGYSLGPRILRVDLNELDALLGLR